MKIGIPQAVYDGEQRAALTPDNAKRLHKPRFQTAFEARAICDGCTMSPMGIAAAVATGR